LRSKTTLVDDSLETIPLGDGVPRAPAAFLNTRLAHAFAPWLEAQQPELAPSREPLGSGTFRRMVPVDAARLAALPQWWEHNSRDGLLEITRQCALGPFAADGANTWSCCAVLRRAPMDLMLWRHLRDWTLLILRPARHPHPGILYFRAGHGALDVLTSRLAAELPHAARQYP
jgi:hypothetical protein